MDNSLLMMGLDVGNGLLDTVTRAWSGFTMPTDWLFFEFIYDFVRREIKVLGLTLMARASYYASLIALALVTIWVFYQGLRIFSGKGDSIMALVINAARVAFIVTAAISMGVGGNAVYDTVGERLPGAITGYVTDSNDTVEEQIDEALFGMTVALKSIDGLNVMMDETIEDDKNRAMYMVAVGTAGPAVTAGALLLFYQAALALFIGLGPIFILCLMFDQTKDLFRKWLMYGIGTMFSMAVLSAMTSIALKVVIAVTAAHWVTAATGGLLGLNMTSGITGAAMQQGGIGLLLTLLIVMVPPMAANFFQGTLGGFQTAAAVGGGVMGSQQTYKQQLTNEMSQQKTYQDLKQAQQGGSVNPSSGQTGSQNSTITQTSQLGPAATTGPRSSSVGVDNSQGTRGLANNPANPSSSTQQPNQRSGVDPVRGNNRPDRPTT